MRKIPFATAMLMLLSGGAAFAQGLPPILQDSQSPPRSAFFEAQGPAPNAYDTSGPFERLSRAFTGGQSQQAHSAPENTAAATTYQR